jgi:Ca-activated chloride channel family protein
MVAGGINMRHFTPALVTAALAATLGAGIVQAASSTPVFRADVELVNVAVTITDAQSRFISGLGESDFQVLEDGEPQDLTLFSHERLPLSLSILLDTSDSMTAKLPEAQAAAIRFVRTLTPVDEAQVIQFDRRATIVKDFTADVPELEKAIRSTHAGGSTALYNAVYIALKDLQERRRAEEPRRMAIVVLSDGNDTASLVSDDQVLALARTTGIAVYGISLCSAHPSALSLSEDTGLPRFFFTALSRATGGQAHFLQGIARLAGVYDEVAEELRSQYSLGYFSSNANRDGRWRQIQVRLPTHTQLQVRHKAGYFAPRR